MTVDGKEYSTFYTDSNGIVMTPEKFDEFSAAEGFEILSDSKEEAEQFAKDVVSCEDKAFRNEEPEMVMGGI